MITNTFEFECSGRIISAVKLKNSESSIVTIVTKNNKEIIYVKARYKGDLSNIPSHGRVRVKGHIELIRKKVEGTDKKYTYTMGFFAKSIELEKTLVETEFGDSVKGKFFTSPFFRAVIKAPIVKVTEDNEWIRYLVNIGNGLSKSIWLNMHKLDRQPVAHEKDTICAVCGMVHQVKTFDNKKVLFENLIISDLCIIPAEENTSVTVSDNAE